MFAWKVDPCPVTLPLPHPVEVGFDDPVVAGAALLLLPHALSPRTATMLIPAARMRSEDFTRRYLRRSRAGISRRVRHGPSRRREAR
jgi:hypothetical protein